MAMNLRTLTIAAALATAAPMAAQASAITLDFEGLNGQVLSATQPYSADLLFFSDDASTTAPATALLWTSAFTGLIPEPPIGPTFVSGNKFSILIDPALTETCTPATAGTAKSCFNRLAFHYYADGASITVWNDNPLDPSQTFGLSATSGGGTPEWKDLVDPATSGHFYDAPGRITRIDFNGGGANAMYIDDVAFSYVGAITGGPPLPEPASFGLVALALAAAGVAGRRRPG